MFSKMATKIDEIFTIDLTITTYRQINSEFFFNFVAFLEINFLYSNVQIETILEMMIGECWKLAISLVRLVVY